MRLLLLILLMGPRFEGCGSEGESTDTVLPRTDLDTCFSDRECEVSACVDVRCLAGVCTRIADTLDRDADGHPPLRCGGMDCDDDDRSVFPGARETCNEVDEDCDGVLDEGAMGRTLDVRPPVFDLRSVVIPWGDAFALTDRQSGVLFVWPVDRNGNVTGPIELLRLSRGSQFVGLHAATSGSDTLVIARTDIGAVLFARIQDERVIAEGEIDFGAQVVDVRVVSHAGDFALAADIQNDTEIRRVVRTSLAAPPLDVGLGGFTSFALDVASSGTHVVVPTQSVGEVGLLFVTDETTFVPVPLMDGLSLAWRPIASGNGGVVAGFDDGFGLSLQLYDVSGPIASAEPGPASDVARTALQAIGDAVGILGATDSNRAIWILDESLTRYLISTEELGADEGDVSMASNLNASAFYGAGGADPRLTLILECGESGE